MARWLIDASVLLACEDVDDTNHADSRRLLTGAGSIATLDLALYEVTDVALRAWSDPAAARRLRELIVAVADDGGVVRVDHVLLEATADLSIVHELTVYDAAYVAAATLTGAELVSCDIRDLVSRGLARRPSDVVAS